MRALNSWKIVEVDSLKALPEACDGIARYRVDLSCWNMTRNAEAKAQAACSGVGGSSWSAAQLEENGPRDRKLEVHAFPLSSVPV